MNAVLLETKGEYPYVVVGTSYIHPFDELDDVEKELRERRYSGPVLMDALLRSGFTGNRRQVMQFNGEEFVYQYGENSISKVLEVSPQVDKAVYEYFVKNPDVLDKENMLPRAQRYLLKKGTLLK